MAPPTWTIADADVLRALELHFNGVRRHKKLLVQMPQLDALDVSRIFNAKFAPLVLEVVERNLEWQADHPALVRSVQERTAALTSKNGQMEDGDDVGAYEAKRLQRIRENQQVLAALGIDKPQPKRVKRTAPSADDDATANRTLRRSTRISEVSTARMVAAEAEALRQAEQQRAWVLSRRERRQAPQRQLKRTFETAVDVPVVDLTADLAQSESPATRLRLSSQELAIDLARFHTQWLGRQLWPTGKQTVMQGVCPSHTPLFSKMSGVQLWKNAVLLFVNVQEDSSSLYDNVFHQVPTNSSTGATDDDAAAVYFRWFAQQRHHLESPVIQRLLQAQKGDPALWVNGGVSSDNDPPRPEPSAGTGFIATSAPKPEPVLLFLRRVNGPYIYCGRLGLLGVHANTSPLEFRWQLLDVAALAWHKIATLLEAANAFVDSAAVVVEDNE